jgi:uncharacterized protein (TIGR02147 family)
LSGKRNLTLPLIRHFSQKFGYSKEETKEWCDCLDRYWRGKRNLESLSLLSADHSSDSYHKLSEELFQFIGNWYHIALLNLLRTKGFRASPPWIAGRLGISVNEAEEAVKRLLRLRLVKWSNCTLVRTKANIKTPDNIPSKAIREAHTQALNLAIASLHQREIHERDVTSMTIAISPRRVQEAKKLIKTFRRRVADLLEEGEKTEVYHLSIALFPLSRPFGEIS